MSSSEAQGSPAISRRRALVVNVAFSYGSAVFAVVTGVLLVPVYLRQFDLATYGAWLASGSVATTLGLLEAGLNQVMQQRLATAVGARDADRFAVVAGSGWVLAGVTVAAILGSAGIISFYVPAWVNAPASSARAVGFAFALAATGSALTIAQTHFFAAAFAWQAPWFPGVTAQVGYGVGIVATLLGLATGLQVVALGVGAFARGVVVFLMALVHVVLEWRRRGLGRPRIDREELRRQAGLMGVLFASRGLSLLVASGEPAIIAAIIGPRAAATYTLTARVFTVGLMLVNPIAAASFSGLAHLRASQSRERVRDVTSELLVVSGAVAAIVVGTAMAMNGRFFHLWLGGDGFGGATLTFTLACAAVLQARTNLLGQIVPALGAIRFGSGVVGVETVLRLGAMVALLPALGSSAVPVAGIAAMAAVSIPAFGIGLGSVLGTGAKRGLVLALAGWPATLVALAIGATAAARPFPTMSWVRFAAEAILISAALGGATLAASPGARNAARGAVAAFARRMAGAPGRDPG